MTAALETPQAEARAMDLLRFATAGSVSQASAPANCSSTNV